MYGHYDIFPEILFVCLGFFLVPLSSAVTTCFNDLGLSRVRIKQPNFRMRGGRYLDFAITAAFFSENALNIFAVRSNQLY